MLRAGAIGRTEVGALQQVLVHAHRALELTAPAKHVAEREVQFSGVGVALYCFDEGVDRFVLLLVEQQVEALEVRLRCLALRALPLADIQP